MANTIYAIGHGRQYRTGIEFRVPPGINLRFGVPRCHQSTGTISGAYLRGDLDTYSETIGGGAMCPEHYLCADLPDMNLRKLNAFKAGIDKGKHTNSWMMAARGASDVRLSAILARIEALGLRQPIEFIWTCCRSPINEFALGKCLFENKKMKIESRDSTDPTPEPGTKGHKKYESDALGVLTVIHQRDIHSVGSQFSSKQDRSDQLSVIGSDRDKCSPEQLFGDPKTGSMGAEWLSF